MQQPYRIVRRWPGRILAALARQIRAAYEAIREAQGGPWMLDWPGGGSRVPERAGAYPDVGSPASTEEG